MSRPPRTFVIVHCSDSWYLPYCLLQASRFIPRDRLVLITDIKHRRYDRWCRVEDIKTHWSEAEALGKNFVNFSPSSAAFELLCIQRWFVMKSFVEKTGVSRIVHLDSDVMVFEDLDRLLDAYDDCDLVKNGFQGPHCLAINHPVVLTEFCRFISSHYSDEATKEKMRADFARWKSEGINGGISDMHFLHTFKAAFEARFKFGDNGRSADGVVIHDNYPARLVIRDNVPYEIGADGRESRLALIHCQGINKKMMPGLSSRKDLAYRWIGARRKLHEISAKLKFG